MGRIKWVAEVDCEYDGPAIVADAAEYEKWMGATPYPLEQRRVLHYWGQFTAELPPPYRQDGGHVYRDCDSVEALRTERDALIAAIEATFKGAKATVDEDEGEAHVLLPDSRQLWIEFGPKSHYDQACMSDEELWNYEFRTPRGRQGSALFWEKQGSGAFYVGVNEPRNELVLLRTWVDQDEFEDAAKAFVDTAPDSEEPAEGVSLTIAAGRTIVAYSPLNYMEILGIDRLKPVMEEVQHNGLGQDEARAKMLEIFRALTVPSKPEEVVMLSAAEFEDIAAVIELVPGSYSATYGSYDPDDDSDEDSEGEEDEAEDSWSCIWCRVKRSGD